MNSTRITEAGSSFTRVRYIVRVNGLLIDPSDPEAFPPTALDLANFVNALPRNNLDNYILCGASDTSLVGSLSNDSSYFLLTLNKFPIASADQDSLVTEARNALKDVSSYNLSLLDFGDLLVDRELFSLNLSRAG